MDSGADFFTSQSYTGVAEEDAKFLVCTSFILIISVDADISAMPATLYPRMQEEGILENNLLRIAYRKAKNLDSEFFSSMR